ncbi:MAG: FAD-dependent oxidoreductase, partial [Candidatus Hinthialibacter sp.]
MSSGGLGKTDVGNPNAITGLSRDFYRRVGRYYGEKEAWRFEPHIAERVFNQYVNEANVEVLFSRRIKKVHQAGNVIESIVLEYSERPESSSDLVISAKVFIDASYEGDLMAKAGVSYATGREPNDQYNEEYNGVQLSRRAGDALKGDVTITPEFPLGVDPYLIPGNPSSGLLPLIQANDLQPIGSGDDKIQAYNFRMCLTQDPGNRIPIAKPSNYSPDRYQLLLRQMDVEPWKSLYDGFIVSKMPNGKTDWNNYGLIGVSTDYIGGNWDYPEADYDRRAEIWQDHKEYQQGLLYFLGHEERIPEHIRKEMLTWGLCKDEFVDTEGWPHQLYIREARRMIGEHVMTEHSCLGREIIADGIAYGSYPLDSHNCQRIVVNGMVRNEGNISIHGFPPYPISYRSITPKRDEAANLLAPVALSASHSAYGSIRMEPAFMVLGQSAGLAASMAVKSGIPVQQVSAAEIQKELFENPLANRPLPDEDPEAFRLKFNRR